MYWYLIKRLTKKSSSFTLIELVMVIAAMGVFVVAVVISIDSAQANKLIGAANKLVFDVRYAQQLALSRHTNCGVLFNPANDNYFVYISDTATKAIDPHTRSELVVDYTANSEYSGMDLASTDFGDLVSFDSMGTPYDSSVTALSDTGTITLQIGSHTRTVTIEPNTGEVKTQ